MLILSRRAGQALIVGENVEITVLEVRGDTVRLGIKAPRSVAVHRKEVYLQIAEANRCASDVDVDALARAGQIRPPRSGAGAQPPGVTVVRSHHPA